MIRGAARRGEVRAGRDHRGAATPGPDGTADQWPCYSSVDAAALAAPTPNPVVREFRIGRGTGAALPHLIR